MKRAVSGIVYSTMGQASRSELGLARPYRWRGVEGWEPGDPRFREDNKPAMGGVANASRRSDRLQRFAVVLAKISVTGLEHASIADIRRAGELVGVGEKTARAYLKALLREEENAP